MVDREFATLAQDVDAYSKQLKTIAKSSDFGRAEITSLSLQEYLKIRAHMVKDITVKPSAVHSFEVAVNELREYGASIVGDLDTLFTPDFLVALGKTVQTTTEMGLIRKAMMYADLDRYFERSWQQKWHEMHVSTRRLLEHKYGGPKLKEIIARYQINPKHKSKG
jgi:hypothetical protein